VSKVGWERKGKERKKEEMKPPKEEKIPGTVGRFYPWIPGKEPKCNKI
jgi:hypothetical protein